MEMRNNQFGIQLPLGQDGVGLKAGSVMSCFLAKTGSKCCKMLIFDTFSTLLYV